LELGNKKIKKGNSDYFSRSFVIKSENPDRCYYGTHESAWLHKDDKERKAKTIEILERVGLGASILIGHTWQIFRRTKTTIKMRLVAK
jgi:hypothetical protein